MGNVLRVLKRDLIRLVKAPAALVVVVALLFLPSIYTWYNVVGFWNPYDNTSHLRVDVVNEDAGGTSDLTGTLCVGDTIVEQLHENDQLDWTFSDYDSAMSALESGESYAVFVIPQDFTEDLLSLTTGNFEQPNLQYYVNEKLGPVSPKITDTGATTLDETINSTFVATVSDAAVETIDSALQTSRDNLDESKSQALAKTDEIIDTITDARTTLGNIHSATDDALCQVDTARGILDDARAQMDLASDALDTVSSEATSMQDALMRFSATALPAVNNTLSSISSASTNASVAAGNLASNLEHAQTNVEAALSQADAIVTENEALATYLHELAKSPSYDADTQAAFEQLASDFDTKNARARTLIDSLAQLSTETGNAAQAISDAAGPINDSVQNMVQTTDALSTDMFGTTIPAVNESLAHLATTSAAMSTALANQHLLGEQTNMVLDQLSSTLKDANEAVEQTDALLEGLASELGTVRTDVIALSSADAVSQLVGEDGLDANRIASFMGSPTEVTTEQLYPLNAYGSAMAPLFMNLTFWIGAFMLLVIMKQEVDAQGIRNLKLWQRYLGRFVLFAIFAVLQAVICCAGVLVIGVQAESVPALFFAASIASLAYLSIIYALSVTLQHIGKGLCIVLVFAQIPGATGLYPIEMTSPFFQTIYPLFPFTYGIGAMREAICGFYGTQYLQDVGILVLFLVVFMALGLIFRPLMANVNHMVARQVRQSDLFLGEDVEIPMRPYRFSQIVRALSDKQEYRDELTRRHERFDHWYPRIIRGAVIVGIAIPVVLMVVFALTPTEKVVLLTICLLSLVALLVLMVVVESLRFSFERQMNLDSMSEEGLLNLYHERNTMAAPADVSAPTEAATPAATTAHADASEPTSAPSPEDVSAPTEQNNADADMDTTPDGKEGDNA